MEVTIKKSWSISFLCLIIAICALLTKFLNFEYESCREVMLDLKNPFSYINKVTNPFLVELVKNATANTTRKWGSKTG